MTITTILRGASRDLDRLVDRIAEAGDHIATELAAADGAIGAQRFSEGGRSSDSTSRVEATILARDELEGRWQSLGTDLNEVVARVQHMFSTCAKAIGTRVPLPVDRCYSDPGLAGYLVPLSEGGWFDPACENAPRSPAARSVSGAQCDRCRMACARWRALNEQPLLPDERVVEFDSKVSAGELGTVHARPASAA